MAVLLVASDRPRAGKTAIVAGMARSLQRVGVNVAACKPMSLAGRTDPDSIYLAANFRGGAPVIDSDSEAGLDAAANAIRSLTGIAEHIAVEVANPASGSGLSSQLLNGLVSRISGRVVAVIEYRSDLSAVALSSEVAPLGNDLAGLLVNQVPIYRAEKTQAVLHQLSANGIPVFGQIPEDRTMLSITMDQLAQQLDGRWELKPSDNQAWVDRFLIGGNIMDSGAGYFGRYSHQAVITRAERPDIQMASLMQDTQCLVLTGGSRPTEYIRVEAAKRTVPILLVEQNTVATADAVGGLMDAIVPHALHKAERMADLLDGQVDLDALLA
jgi:BioD-like phosphotransacetylase family protein